MSKENKEHNINLKKTGNNMDRNEKKKKRRRLLWITFVSGILLTLAVYAWFSATLNVKIKSFNMAVASDTGLTISLDGINFSSEIEVSLESILNDLTPRYPNHKNRWVISGLWPVSTIGIRNANSNRFSMYSGSVVKRRKNDASDRRYLFAVEETDDRATPTSIYLAFDFFLKNVTPSPYPDNLFFEIDSMIDFTAETSEEVRKSTGGAVNSLRFGVIFMDTVGIDASVETIQNIGCNNNCKSVIWEPNSTSHTEESIENAKKYNITLVDGVYTPTYAITRAGGPLDHTGGHPGTGIPLDTNHFALQRTITDLNEQIYQMGNSIVKCRGYLWIEGQDIDSLEIENVKSATLEVLVSISKDLAGYEL